VEHAKLLSGKLDQLQESGAPQPGAAVRTHVDATDLVRVAEQLARTVCQGRPVVVDAPEGRLPVRVNQDEVLDVLGNLVLNAHRFAPPLSPLHLVAEVQDGQVVLAVEDDGVEVTPERRERIFDEQGVGRDGRLGGGGLAHGVAMARQLAHANGGELRAVEAEGAGGKARFELWLPLEPASALGGAPEPEGPLGAARPEAWRLFGPDRPHAPTEPRDPAPTKR
ncbi:MAG TPA: ATP-binding protein, partial [Actinomycetota bacterium]